MADLINMEIAGISFSVQCRQATILQSANAAYQPFFFKKNISNRQDFLTGITKADNDSEAIDIDISLELNNMPDTDILTKIFDSSQSWSMFLDGDNYFLEYRPPAFNRPFWIAHFDSDLKEATVHCGDILISEREKRPAVSNPLHYPLDQLLLMYILSTREGALFHAAGAEFCGRGYIFPGRSGAGKSTLSRQFAARDNIRMLNDDRVVIRKADEAFKVFGTPWPGEAGIAINKDLPLSGILFISQGSENRIKEINPKEALERLLPVTSIPWYDRKVMPEILLFCEDLISHVPTYELYFKPGIEVLDVLEKFVSK